MPFLQPLPEIRRHIASGEYELCGDLHHRGSHGDVITAPHGYLTDLASIPKPLQWWTPPGGAYEAAAIIHDRCCDALNAGKPIINSRDTDGLFRLMMAELGTPIFKRWIMWAAVRLGSVANSHRREWNGLITDMPLMLIMLLIAIPAILPGTIWYGLLYVIDLTVTKLVDLASDPEASETPTDEWHDGPGTTQCH